MKHYLTFISKTIGYLIALFALSLTTGCGTLLAPQTPKVLADSNIYTVKQHEEDSLAYEVALKDNKIEIATAIRNKMLWRVISDVNRVYFTFRNEFNENRQIASTVADTAKLGMSAAATVLGGSAALSAAVTALQGSQLAVEKNFFREKTTETLFITMDALRSEQMTLIENKLKLDPPRYGFDEAFNDASLLFNAGTVISALQRMTAVAGRENIKAKEESSDATMLRVEASLSPISTEAIGKKEKLSAAVQRLTGDLTDSKNLNQMKTILLELGAAPSPADTAAQLSQKIKALLRNARSDDQINKMSSAFEKAGAIQ